MLENSQAEPTAIADQAAARPAAARAHRAVSALRRHWPAATLLAAGLVLRVLAQFAYRPVLFYIDTTRYLYNDAPGMDPVGYKGPLRAILAVANFNTVAAIQHLLGLAMAVGIYVLLLRRGIPRWLAALAMAPLLLDAYQIQIEQTVMPDTWFEALILAGLAILLLRPSPGWRAVAAGGLVLGTSAIFAQVGEALLPAVLLYLVALGGGWRLMLRRAAAASAAFALPILAYCTVNELATGNFFLSHTGVTTLYGRTAAAADCATLRLPQAERGMCPTPHQQALGPDFLEFDNGSPVRPYYNGLARDHADRLITDFNHRVLTQQPLRVLRAYLRDVVRPFALTRDGSPGVTAISRWQFQTAYPYFAPHASRTVIDASVDRFGGGRPAVWAPVAGFLRGYQLHGGYTPGPLFALCVLAGLAGSASLLVRWRAGPAAREPARACLLLFASAAALLLVSDVFEFSWRYLLPALVTLIPAGALGLAVVLCGRGAAGLPREDPAG
jgi:hypothetical protein